MISGLGQLLDCFWWGCENVVRKILAEFSKLALIHQSFLSVDITTAKPAFLSNKGHDFMFAGWTRG